jgi:hypothetical protein
MALRCLSSSIFRYRLVDQRVPTMWRNLAAARLMAELPWGENPDHSTFNCRVLAQLP